MAGRLSRYDVSYASHETTLSESNHPSETLRRHLSVRPVVSTTSSFAQRMSRAAKDRSSEPKFRIIGLGSCGTVFEIPGTEVALKKGKDVDALWNDFCLTNMVSKALAETREVMQSAFPDCTIPRTPHCSSFYLPTSSEFWSKNLSKFPSSHRERGALFQVDRILPLAQPIRNALIEQYFDDDVEVQEEAKNDESNESCLVRVYLGANEEGNETYDSLRNFPMCLNMVEELGLDKTGLADEMAIALATCHWRAQVDAMDAEFVLGSACATPLEKRQAYHLDEVPHEVYECDFTSRATHLWFLDFDKSTRIKLTPEHVEKYLVPAFLGNDPYYPRPDVDKELWERFGETYREASRVVLVDRGMGAQVMDLPGLFLEKVEEMIKKHADWDPEKDITFGY